MDGLSVGPGPDVGHHRPRRAGRHLLQPADHFRDGRRPGSAPEPATRPRARLRPGWPRVVAARRLLFQAAPGQSAVPKTLSGPHQGNSGEKLHGRVLPAADPRDGRAPEAGSRAARPTQEKQSGAGAPKPGAEPAKPAPLPPAAPRISPGPG